MKKSKNYRRKWIFANKSYFCEYMQKNLRIFDEIIKILIKCDKKDKWSNFKKIEMLLKNSVFVNMWRNYKKLKNFG